MTYPPGARPDPPNQRTLDRLAPHRAAEERANLRERGVRPPVGTLAPLEVLRTMEPEILTVDLRDPRLPDPGTLEGEAPSREFIEQVRAAGCIRRPLEGQWQPDGSIRILAGRRRYKTGRQLYDTLARTTVMMLVYPIEAPGWVLTLEENNARAENLGSDVWAIDRGLAAGLSSDTLRLLAGMNAQRMRSRMQLVERLPHRVKAGLVHGGVRPTVARAVARQEGDVRDAAAAMLEGGARLTTRAVDELAEAMAPLPDDVPDLPPNPATGEFERWRGDVLNMLAGALRLVPGEATGIRDAIDQAIRLTREKGRTA